MVRSQYMNHIFDVCVLHTLSKDFILMLSKSEDCLECGIRQQYIGRVFKELKACNHGNQINNSGWIYS